MSIKPCPFCGKPARLRGSDDFWYVECADINCMATVAGQNTAEEAVECWNRRPYESSEPTADA